MLDSGGDYDYVNVSGIGDITGNVLPARDEAGGGSWQVLDWEDYLFLLEAFYERTNWEDTPGVSIDPGGRYLSLSALNGVKISSTLAAKYIDKDFAFTATPISTTSSATILNTLGASVALETVTFDKRLQADEIRKLFWNYAQLKRAVKTVQLTDLATSWIDTVVYTRSNGDTATNPPTDHWGYLWQHGNASRVGSPFSVLSITLKNSFGTFPYATAAWLLLKIYSVANSGSTWYDVVAIPCTVSSGTVSVPSLSGVASTICAAHGLAGTTSPGYITSGGGSVSISECLLVVDNDFPAEIDSLNWSWSPT